MSVVRNLLFWQSYFGRGEPGAWFRATVFARQPKLFNPGRGHFTGGPPWAGSDVVADDLYRWRSAASRTVVARVQRRLKRRGVETGNLPIGIMIEVPGAALAADALAGVFDFFAVGTNDLIMYTLAIDRADEQVAHLYDPLHPAVLRLIQFSAQAALRARIPISVCGEMAGDPWYTALLLGLGVRELSMSSANLPRVKERVRALDPMASTRRAEMIMDQAICRIEMLLDDFNELA